MSTHKNHDHDSALQSRIQREAAHGEVILSMNESNWGWGTAAGKIRWNRRLNWLTNISELEAPVLEIGCGTGTFSQHLAQKFRDLTCIDISPALLARAKAKCGAAIKFVEGDIHKMPFPDNSFAAIVGCSVLHHLNWNVALKELHRVLRPGGVMRFSEPNLLNPQIYLQKNWPWLKQRLGDSYDEYAFTAAQIRESATQAGYVGVRAEAFEFLHPATPPALIPIVSAIESILQKTPARMFAGSLAIEARKPAELS